MAVEFTVCELKSFLIEKILEEKAWAIKIIKLTSICTVSLRAFISNANLGIQSGYVLKKCDLSLTAKGCRIFRFSRHFKAFISNNISENGGTKRQNKLLNIYQIH